MLKEKLNIAIRVDANSEIGGGHFRRCLTLAQEAQKRGHSIKFISAQLPGKDRLLLKKNKLSYDIISEKNQNENITSKKTPNKFSHDKWLKLSILEDAKITSESLDKFNPNWIIFDHYSLDIEWVNIVKKKQPETWESFFKTANKSDTETIIKKGEIITLNEYYYGKSRLHLVAPLHQKYCMHPIYAGWYYAFDLRIDIEPLLNLSINELKVEMKKSPKFLRTIRSNKAPIIVDAKYGMKAEPYSAMDRSLINKRADIVKNNEKFSQNILHALREVAEEKEQSKTQEDIYAEESIYTKFTSNKDTALFPAWHAASWKDKLKLLDKFDDDRLVGFGKKIIFREAPEVLPENMLKSIKREIAKRILSEKKEKWWTIPTLYTEIDTLREKYTNENDNEKLALLDEFNEYAMSIQKKYENV